MEERVLLDREDIRRALIRIAHQIVERNQGVEGLILVGLRTRGVYLARRVAEAICSFEGAAILTADLDIRPYRDDRDISHQRSLVPLPRVSLDIAGQTVVLVDDVLYTGRTVRAALDALMDLGRPRAIQLAVLVDRGHRELPIRADYVGKNVPTSQHERVQVRLLEVDGADEIVLTKHGSHGTVMPYP